MHYFSKSHIFLYSILLVWVLVLYKTISFPSSGTIKIQITQQKGSIKTIDTIKTPHVFIHSYLVDRLDFPHAKILKHEKLGVLGFSSNFFINAQTEMNVLLKDRYQFIVTSDDGFRLTMDHKLICEHPKDRPYESTICDVDISKGKHRFNLDYFQGAGPLGLHVQYRQKRKALHDVGEDSDSIIFEEIQDAQ